MNIKTDSRKIKEGDIFVALNTFNDGHKYVEDAIKNGAKKVIVNVGNYDVETIIVPDTKEYLINHLKNNYYRSNLYRRNTEKKGAVLCSKDL